MKTLLLSAILLFNIQLMFANPNWKRTALTQSTIFNGIVTFNGEQAEEGDIVAAFVDGECRMVSTVKHDGIESYVSGILHSEETEQAILYYWRASDDKTYISDTVVTTVPQGEIMKFPIAFNSSTTTSTADISENTVLVYPTIIKDIITIQSATDIKSIKLLTTAGIEVEVDFSQSDDIIQFSGSSLTAGTYIISILLETDETVTKEIIKQ